MNSELHKWENTCPEKPYCFIGGIQKWLFVFDSHIFTFDLQIQDIVLNLVHVSLSTKMNFQVRVSKYFYSLL